MQTQNLGSLPKNRHLTGLVLYNTIENTREVFMSEKFCKIHNILLSIKTSSKKYYCKKCSCEKTKEYYKINKSKIKKESNNLFDSFSETKIIKICENHGKLTKKDIFIRSINSIKCRYCLRESVKKNRLKDKDNYLEKVRNYRKENIEIFRERDRKYKNKDYKERKEIYVIRSKRFYDNNKDKVKNYRLKKSYGIDLNFYNKMLEEQNGLCFICNEPETVLTHKKDKIKDLAVDHNHYTKQVRKLLCTKCNCLIGYSRESIDILLKVINYLKLFDTEIIL